jgi:geranylgeranylglycerol-phosphate geranylgeranyltransferase
MINSYFDREIDKIAHPNRPMASGIVSVSDAKVFMVLTFIACCIFLLLSKMFLIAFVSILSIIYYFR